MHSFWARLNNLFFFALTTLGVLFALTAFSTYAHTSVAHVSSVKVNSVRALRNNEGIDRALLNFDLDTDLSGVWNWNVKQLFVVVYAEFSTKKHPINQVVLWDHIAQTPEASNITLHNKFNKYVLVDHGDELRDKDIELKLLWDIMPVSGRILKYSSPAAAADSHYTMPSNYM